MNLEMQSYIETVCSFVKSQEVHCDIQSELENHIIESVDEYKASGFSEDEAFKKALALMGDPKIVGKQLNQAHKPRIDWKTISLVTTLIGIGLASLYSMQLIAFRRCCISAIVKCWFGNHCNDFPYVF